jgi:hypothetical protein
MSATGNYVIHGRLGPQKGQTVHIMVPYSQSAGAQYTRLFHIMWLL